MKRDRSPALAVNADRIGKTILSFLFLFHRQIVLLVCEVFFNGSFSDSAPLASFRAHNGIIVSSTEIRSLKRCLPHEGKFFTRRKLAILQRH